MDAKQTAPCGHVPTPKIAAYCDLCMEALRDAAERAEREDEARRLVRRAHEAGKRWA